MCHTRRIQGFLPHADLSSYKRLFQKRAGMSKLEGCRIHPAEEWQGVCRNEHCLNFIWLFISFQVGIQEPARLDIVGLQAVEPVVKPIRWHTPCSFLFPRFGVMERGILEVSSRQYSVSQKFSYIVDSNILQNLLQPAMPMSQNFSYIERSTTKRFLRASRVFPRPLLTMSQTK